MKYDASFKLKVVRFAKASNNTAAAREFGIYEKQVREWKKAEEKLTDIPRTKCALRRGKQQWPELEKLFKWVNENRESGYVITGNVICTYAMKLAKSNLDTDGTKLKPMIIFKGKTIPKVKFPAGAYVHVQENGWEDEEGVRLWLEHIWSRRPGGLRKERSLLEWDMFQSHLTEPEDDVVREDDDEAAAESEDRDSPEGTTSSEEDFEGF
ncbi:Pogo transposable element-like 58 [Homarus americanus]|uniref:Pogo transposable element-like 58 n=1 Tax=Homarus americanus TaxID=6706 RepID=A0A8J5N8A4_HOMAM|nr:Pogo transposable element-like 58 [Homarus americanus]